MASQSAGPKPPRPRLSLHTKMACGPPSKGLRGQPVNPSDPTTFNTLSNIYVTAIERCSALQSEPVSAINTLRGFSLRSPIEAPDSARGHVPSFAPTYPDTPLSAQTSSSPRRHVDFTYPSTMTATPPLSASAVDEPAGIFTFSSADTALPRSCRSAAASPIIDRGSPCNRTRASVSPIAAARVCPYAHPESLRSILRNSPLPSRRAKSSPLARRRALHVSMKPAKKVEYDSPLEQEIITSTYTRSHIDLLTDDGSPLSPTHTRSGAEVGLQETAMAFTANEIRDGGGTPGPFEGVRCRLAGLSAGSPVSPGVGSGHASRKRKRAAKQRHWEWTIGQEDGIDEVKDACAALRGGGANKRAKMLEQRILGNGARCSSVPVDARSAMEAVKPAERPGVDAPIEAANVVEGDSDATGTGG